MMWRNIRLLTGVMLRDLWGINRIRHGSDSKQKRRLIMLAVVLVLVALIFGSYSGLISFGLVFSGMGDLVPAYMLMAVSLVILLFSIYKAGPVIFDKKSYEMLSALPVEPASIIVSRFLTMYLENAVMGIVIMAPAAGVYAVMQKPGAGFYLTMVLGIFLMPFLPMTLATAAGALVTAVSSRMKHKNLVTIVLTLALTMGFLAFTMVSGTKVNHLDMEDIRNLGSFMEKQIYSFYPPARLFTAGVIEGNALAFAGFAAISLGGFALLVAIVQWRFAEVCAALNAGASAGSYKMGELKSGGVISALYKRELSRYFASSIYVMNTLIGYLMMVLCAAALFVAGVQKVEALMGMPGIIVRLVPLFMAAMCSFSTTTASSVSMEGRNWWLIKSLPVTSGQLFTSKMLVNLTVALPCYIVALVLLLLGVNSDWMDKLWMTMIPLAYILFVTVLGITVNCKMPVFDWESEAAVVKQSGAMLLNMVVGFLSVLIPVGLLLVFNELSHHLVMGLTFMAIVVITVILYQRNRHIDLRTIE